ncbi:MAG: cytochrome c oxidase subunit II [Desulfurococcales archaeon]|nr:cytochrome c oxidase subunit II [Desulfurococcales archaeon]
MFHYPFDPSSLAETARIWWDLYGYYLFLAIVIGSAVMTLLVVIPLAYRYKPGSSNPRGKDEIRPGEIPGDRGRAASVLLMTVLLLGVFFGLLTQSLEATKEFKEVEFNGEIPDGALVIEVIGFQWGWTFRYPNGAETDVLIIPAGRMVVFNVTSEDVFHAFAIPDLRVKVDAIPGRYNIAWTKAYQPGIYRVQCYELCGVGHAEMITKVMVVTEDVFDYWYKAQAVEETMEEAPHSHG